MIIHVKKVPEGKQHYEVAADQALVHLNKMYRLGAKLNRRTTRAVRQAFGEADILAAGGERSTTAHVQYGGFLIRVECASNDKWHFSVFQTIIL